MNRNVIIGVFIAILIGIGIWLVLLREQAVAPATIEDENLAPASQAIDVKKTSSVTENFSGSGSFLDLMGMGKNLMCEFSYVADDTGGAVAGTVYISGERMRGDFEMEQGGQVYSSSMIQAEDMMYTWSQTPQGTMALKMPLDDGPSDTDASGANEYDRTVDMNAAVEYDCRQWNVDNRVFVPPSDIEFLSPDEMMQGFMQGFDPSDYTE